MSQFKIPSHLNKFLNMVFYKVLYWVLYFSSSILMIFFAVWKQYRDFFADDTTLLITGKTPTEVQAMTNSELEKVSPWMVAHNLAINASKTVALNISSKGRICFDFDTLSCTFSNESVQPFASAKYLGITIDRLSFKNPIALLENKIARSIGVMTKLSYYLPQDTLLTLYYSLVHTHSMYALPVWKSTRKTCIARLQTLQNTALRIISKTPLKNNITPQFYKLGILKLHDSFTFEIAKIMHQFTHKKLPTNFFSFFTYSADVSPYLTR